MRVTIIQEDGVVGVDGVFRRVDLSDLDANIHAIQWDSEKGKGHIEYDDSLEPRLENAELRDFAPYSVYVSRWEAAAPRAPDPAVVATQQAERDLDRKKSLALQKILEGLLEREVSNPSAPQEVKDYALALARKTIISV